MSQYFSDLMADLGQRKRALEANIHKTSESAQKADNEKNKRELKRAKRREAKYAAMLLKTGNSTSWNEHDRQHYIMQSKWLSRWKKYVEYDEHVIKHKEGCKLVKINSGNSQASTYPSPGPITNKQMMLDSKEYYHDFTCSDSIYNNILQDLLEMDKDYHIVSKELWEFLHEKYGGITVARNNIPVGPNGARRLDLKLTKVIQLNNSLGKACVH
jgi:hypothetical protein